MKKKYIITIVCLTVILSVLFSAIFVLKNLFNENRTSKNKSEQTSGEQVYDEITEQEANDIIELTQEIAKLEENDASIDKIRECLEESKLTEHIAETADGGLDCRFKCGVTGVWTPESEDMISANDEDNGSRVLPLANITSDGKYEVEKIVILCPYASEDSDFILEGYEFLAECIKDYTECTVTVLKDGEVSLDMLKNLDEYDMVWFYSHGALSNVYNSAWDILDSDPYTMTGEFADSAVKYTLYSNDFFAGRTVINLSSGRIGVGGGFYEHYYSSNQLENVFFHFGSCNSMRTERLASGILSRGAAWVQGWSDKVYFNNDYMQLTSVVISLLEGKNIRTAVANAPSAVDRSETFYQPRCELKGSGNGNYELKCIITPEEAVEIYLENKSLWMLNPEYMPMAGYYYALLDLDFDGVLELLTNINDGSGRFSTNTFYRINPETRAVEKVKIASGEEDICYDFFSSDDIKLYKAKDDTLMYYCNDLTRVRTGEYGTLYGWLYMEDEEMASQELFFEHIYDQDLSASEGVTNQYFYYENGNDIEVNESKYNAKKVEFFKDYTDMELKADVIFGQDLDDAAPQKQKELLLEAYMNFEYKGFSFK